MHVLGGDPCDSTPREFRDRHAVWTTLSKLYCFVRFDHSLWYITSFYRITLSFFCRSEYTSFMSYSGPILFGIVSTAKIFGWNGLLHYAIHVQFIYLGHQS